MQELTWREKLRLLLQGAASITNLRRPKPVMTPEEWVAKMDAVANDPEHIAMMRNIKPAFYINRTTGEMRQATLADDIAWLDRHDAE